MSVVLHWFLPTSGDSRTVVPFGPDGHRRPPTLDYLAQIARAADDLGYTGVLTPTGTWCEDSWLVTAALLRETKRLKFLVAFRPGLTARELVSLVQAAGHYPADVSPEQLEQYLAQAPREHPVFVWVHLFEPHEPYDPPPAFARGETPVERYDGEVAAGVSRTGELTRVLGRVSTLHRYMGLDDARPPTTGARRTW